MGSLEARANVPDDDIMWDEIVSIEHVGEERVYDIEVEETHNFVGNNIFAHNTAIFGGGVVSMGTSTSVSGTQLFVQGQANNTPLNVASSSGASLLTVTAAGNVGIGTTSPVATLAVNGSLFVATTTTTTNLIATTATTTNLSVTSLTSGNCVQAGPAGLLQSASGACGSGSGQSTYTIQSMFQGGSYNVWTSGFINASTSLINTLTAVNLNASSSILTNATTTGQLAISVKGSFLASDATGMIIATTTPIMSLTGGTNINTSGNTINLNSSIFRRDFV